MKTHSQEVVMNLRTLVAVGAVVAVVPVTALAADSIKNPLLSAKLVGKTEVPKGDPDGSGVVNLVTTPAIGKVCWTFTSVKKIAKPTAAHIHRGKAGVAGPVVVPFGTAYKSKGCASASKSLINSILSNPGNYYVNIHNAKYPAGAIRGQLHSGPAKP